MKDTSIYGISFIALIIGIASGPSGFSVICISIASGAFVYGFVSTVMEASNNGHRQQNNFSPPVIQRMKSEVVHVHKHEHYNFKSMHEGTEIHERMPDGREITIRHVKKYE